MDGIARRGRIEETDHAARWIAEALREHGHQAEVCEGDGDLLDALARFMPTARDGSVTGMVFNLARGLQGEVMGAHVPAMLEMACVPYTGPTPLGHALAFDQLATRALLAQAHLPMPRYRVLRWPGDETDGLALPLLVTPRYATASPVRRIVTSRAQLGNAVEEILLDGEQEAFVEEYVRGAEIRASFVGNDDDLELLPFVPEDADAAGAAGDADQLAPPSRSLAMHVGSVAASAFRTCHCRDFGRVELRLGRAGEPLVVGIDAAPSLRQDRGFVRAAVAGGYGPTELAARLLDTAHRRYFGIPAPRFDLAKRDSSPAGHLRLFGPPR